MSTPQIPTADDFLMGGGVTSAKFPALGSTVAGRITEKPTVEQQKDFSTGAPKFWDDGSPQMQLVVTLATAERDPAVPDDDGARRLYVKGQMKTAVAQAVRSSGARGLEVGGTLSVTYTANGEQKNPRFNPPKNFTASYTPAATNVLHTPDPAPAPPQYAAPAPAVPGLTAQQIAAAQADPATAALLAQIQQQTPAQPVGADKMPPF
jgi:hypothetical protein